MIYLDSLTPEHAGVGYGTLGTGGALGYEGKRVQVMQRPDPHALSAHPPARLRYCLNGEAGDATEFVCRVALNDDVAGRPTRADFLVLADGVAVAVAAGVLAGEPPRPLRAPIAGARTLELITRAARFDFCHALWLEPRLEHAPAPASLPDCLRRADLTLPPHPLRAERCIVTVSSPGFEALLDDLLRTLRAFGGVEDALRVVLLQPEDEAGHAVAARYGAHVLTYRPRRTVNSTLKSLLYSVGHAVVAREYLCLDADMVVLGALDPLFAALDACPEGSILAVREANSGGEVSEWTLAHALRTVYFGRDGDLRRLLARLDGEAGYPLVVNDGLFAAGRVGLMALDGLIRSMEGASAFTDERHDVWWRNQFVFNLALARMRCGVALDDLWNVQMDCQEIEVQEGMALWQGRAARVLHFNGRGRHKHAGWRAALAREEQL